MAGIVLLKQNLMKRILQIIPLLIILCPVNLHAQQHYLRAWLKQTNTTFTMPEGYVQASSSDAFVAYTNHEDRSQVKALRPMLYRIISRDSTVLISYIFLDLKTYDTSSLLRKLFPGNSPDTDYMLKIKMKADTLREPVRYFDQETTNGKFHATVAGTYSFQLEIPYEGRYHFCRVVFMHKKNEGDVEVYYFYDPEKERIKPEETFKMVRFVP